MNNVRSLQALCKRRRFTGARRKKTAVCAASSRGVSSNLFLFRKQPELYKNLCESGHTALSSTNAIVDNAISECSSQVHNWRPSIKQQKQTEAEATELGVRMQQTWNLIQNSEFMSISWLVDCNSLDLFYFRFGFGDKGGLFPVANFFLAGDVLAS